MEDDDCLLNEMLYVFDNPEKELNNIKISNKELRIKGIRFLNYLKNKKDVITLKDKKMLRFAILTFKGQLTPEEKIIKSKLIRTYLNCYNCRNKNLCLIMDIKTLYRLFHLQLKCKFFELKTR